jgi:hypothetical protein
MFNMSIVEKEVKITNNYILEGMLISSLRQSLINAPTISLVFNINIIFDFDLEYKHKMLCNKKHD